MLAEPGLDVGVGTEIPERESQSNPFVKCEVACRDACLVVWLAGQDPDGSAARLRVADVEFGHQLVRPGLVEREPVVRVQQLRPAGDRLAGRDVDRGAKTAPENDIA